MARTPGTNQNTAQDTCQIDIVVGCTEGGGVSVAVTPWRADVLPTQHHVLWVLSDPQECFLPGLTLAVRATGPEEPWPFPGPLAGRHVERRNWGTIGGSQLPPTGGPGIAVRYEIVIEGAWRDGRLLRIVLDPEMHIKR